MSTLGKYCSWNSAMLHLRKITWTSLNHSISIIDENISWKCWHAEMILYVFTLRLYDQNLFLFLIWCSEKTPRKGFLFATSLGESEIFHRNLFYPERAAVDGRLISIKCYQIESESKIRRLRKNKRENLAREGKAIERAKIFLSCLRFSLEVAWISRLCFTHCSVNPRTVTNEIALFFAMHKNQI